MDSLDKAASRTCGDCSMCCRLMGVPEVKEDHKWCPWCRPGAGGCSIYATRPERCRDFHCQWLKDDRVPDRWRPTKSRIVIDMRQEDGRKVMIFVVDPTYPGRWREEPWFSDIKVLARAGLKGTLGEKWKTVVLIKDLQIPIIP